MSSQNRVSPFTHLHVHTEYSIVDGISRIPDLVARTGELGMDSLAITDHGDLYGVVDFYSACKEAGIKPIIGCEVYVAHDSRFTRNPAERQPNHLVLLARDNVGYRNLMKLATKSHVEGFYQKPRIDKDLLQEHREGLVCLSGCLSAEIPGLLDDGNYDEARKAVGWYKEVFGENYFLELQRHDGLTRLDAVNDGLVRLNREMGVPLVATNDTHYVVQPHAGLHDIYLCIQRNTNIQDEKRSRMEGDSFFVKSPQQMAELFHDFPEALENTRRVADMCNVELDFGQAHLPKYPTPDGMDADQYLAEICWKGFRRLYDESDREAEERLRYELDVIRYTQFANYFLVVWDIIDFVRRNKILFAIRGSAAASVALYCLGITDVDPLKYRLVFERFLNMERKEMPDIDMDFQDDRRDEVLHYVIERYGSEQVAQIITFGTFGAKAALRDVGRALGMSYGDVDRIARMVPFKARTLEDALKVNPEFQRVYDEEPAVNNLVEQARGLEGGVRNIGTHAAGVLIADEPLTETVPLRRPVHGDEDSPVLMTQYSMDPVAKLGLLKMDFLGLTNLTILDRAVNLVRESRGVEINLQELSLDDPDTFALLSSGNTTDLFQLESAGMQRYIKELKPSTLGDIAAMIALYRPGPMENIEAFIESKHGRREITYPHPSLKELLDETYGIIVYQDQVLLILQQFAGYSLGAADIVRKAMGKKIASLMAQERDNFVAGAQEKGYARDLSIQIFNLIEPFAGYAFNKAHSVSYGLISYWTGYFKAHYPVEYMCSVLNSRLDNPDRIVSSINECFRLGISVRLPDVNQSEELFTIDEDGQSLRIGLAAIKTVGEGAVKPLVEERKANGPYKSIDDFCRRADSRGLNRRTMEALAKAGSFDGLAPRGAVVEAVEQIVATSQLEARRRDSGQTSFFDGGAEESKDDAFAGITLGRDDVPDATKATWEKELLGVSLSYNPLLHLARLDAGGAINALEQIDEDMEGESKTLLGQVSAVSERYTREQKRFLIITFDMLGGPIEVVVWPNVLEQTDGLWNEGTVLRVTGKLRSRGDQMSLACDAAQEYGAAPTDNANGSHEQPRNGSQSPPKPESHAGANGNGRNGNGHHRNGNGANGNGHRREPAPANGGYQRTLFIGVVESSNPQEDAHRLREAIGVLLEYQGQDRVNLEIHTNGTRVLLELPVVNTGYCDELDERLTDLLGAGSVRYQAGL